jgi:hypothetical protein
MDKSGGPPRDWLRKAAEIEASCCSTSVGGLASDLGLLSSGASSVKPVFGLIQHVTPIDDEREHVEAADCWCGPTAEHGEGSVLFIHNAADMREEYEKVTGDGLPDKPWLLVELTSPSV